MNYKMKLCAGLLLLTSTLFAQTPKRNKAIAKEIVVQGEVKFPDPTGKYKIYLGQMKGEGFKKVFSPIDSVQLNADNTFSFHIKTAKPDFYQIRVYYMDRIDFWADKDDLKIKFRGIDTARVKVKNPPYILIEGSEDNNVINLANFISYRNYQTMIAIGKQQYKANQAKDSLWMRAAGDQMGALYDDQEERIRNIVRMYKDRPTVLYALKALNWKKDSELMMSTLEGLTLKYPWFKQAMEEKEAILANKAQTKRIENGNLVPAFSYADVNGKKYSPADFKGKYLVVDFWASWCGPCRQEIPNLKALYAKYHDKGLEILGVSIDAKPNDWKKALKEENMPWPQVNAQDSKQVMNDYLFSGIPFMVVVDREGKIVEKNLRGEGLSKKLKELMP
ncbi:TlpA disulfide reductase family protein [Pedobacter nutrimenti]|uniref:TlpA disulfide reductase family protein n=1 Tax=Pedobacter nutrimenti TaxID=1241337 RepID=UPI00292D4D07|nr:TlpA disulfide reductase family protein [Pedobacter nutrimenti]